MIDFKYQKSIINRPLTYDEVQIAAIEQAVRSKVMVLTGGPGTGRTDERDLDKPLPL